MKITNSKAVRFTWGVALILVFWQACSPNPVDAVKLINDKLGHFLVFLVLGTVAIIGWTESTIYNRLLLALGGYGILIECVQHFVPGRFFSIADWIADILGLIIAFLFSRRVANTIN